MHSKEFLNVFRVQFSKSPLLTEFYLTGFGKLSLRSKWSCDMLDSVGPRADFLGSSFMVKPAYKRSTTKRTWHAIFGGAVFCGTVVRKEIPDMR
jgi:hypothetical protein